MWWSDLARRIAWLALAGAVSACAADAAPKPAAVVPATAGVCPLRAGAAPSQIDVFDGDPSEQVFLAPDDDRKGANTYTVKPIYDQGRAVTVRCHFGKEAVDVKLAKPVAVCRYSEVGGQPQLACK
jgi:hypothetical protein